MSHKTLQSRVADVRTTWSRSERERRAQAGERRRRELLARLGLWTSSTSRWATHLAR